LLLLNSTSFHGNVTGFTGSGTGAPATSDKIDLGDINFLSANFSKSYANNILTVSDGSHTANIQMVGTYTLVNFHFAADGSGGTLVTDPPTFTTIDSGGSLELHAPSNETVSFAGGTGSLVLDQPEAFTGKFVGFTGTAPDPAHSDTIDLIGIDYNSSHFAEMYSASTGLLTVTDGNHTASLAFVDFNATLDFASDGNGGTLITDPPLREPAAPSLSTSTTSEGVSGSITFAAANSASAETASFKPDGSNYLGSFSVGPVTENNGAASAEFNLNNDQTNLAPGQTLTQSYNVIVADRENPAAMLNQTVSVSIGGSGNDNFVFKPGIGADTIVNFNAQHDTLELDNFSNAQTTQQLQALIITDVHGDAVIELGHGDSVTLASTTAQQLQAIVQNAVHLH
jgi:hypothetical protein